MTGQEKSDLLIQVMGRFGCTCRLFLKLIDKYFASFSNIYSTVFHRVKRLNNGT
jgi:hypothetical protein